MKPEETQPLSFNQLAKIVEENGYTLMGNIEFKKFTDKMFYLEEEVKRLKKLNEKYRNNSK